MGDATWKVADGDGIGAPCALVVEDSAIERALLRAALERAGLAVIEAASGDEALRAFTSQPPDVVLLDILMPGIDGFETCRRIRALPAGAATPVIVTTSLEDEDAIAQAYAAGATDFVTKPINLSALVHRTRYVLRAHRVLANLDVLTGLPGRAVFSQWLACRQDGPWTRRTMRAVIYLDLDRFRRINDTLGRDAGDELLKQVAARLRASLRIGDVVRDLARLSPQEAGHEPSRTLLARAGGDEFVIWMEDLASAQDADAVAGRLLEVIRAPFELHGETLHVTASVGVALDGDAAPATALVERAEIAMDQAKHGGRDARCFYDAATAARARRMFSLETVLRRALETDCFRMHFQPKVDLATWQIRGMEALMRLEYPGYGTIAPGDFIPVAEQTGLIASLDRWALRESCREVRRCADVGLEGLSVAINLSASMFQERDLARQVADVLAETGLPPRLLEIELTERLLLEDTRSSLTTLAGLRELGVRVAMDDFGTGYSSLSYLKRFKVNGLKIDRSFIRDVTCDTDDAAIVSAIVGLGRRLGMVVTAEGVETPAQARFLRECGCQEAQGFLFSPALAMGELVGWVRAFGPARAVPAPVRAED